MCNGVLPNPSRMLRSHYCLLTRTLTMFKRSCSHAMWRGVLPQLSLSSKVTSSSFPLLQALWSWLMFVGRYSIGSGKSLNLPVCKSVHCHQRYIPLGVETPLWERIDLFFVNIIMYKYVQRSYYAFVKKEALWNMQESSSPLQITEN